jgi:hypothetical protein
MCEGTRLRTLMIWTRSNQNLKRPERDRTRTRTGPNENPNSTRPDHEQDSYRTRTEPENHSNRNRTWPERDPNRTWTGPERNLNQWLPEWQLNPNSRPEDSTIYKWREVTLMHSLTSGYRIQITWGLACKAVPPGWNIEACQSYSVE